MKKFVAIAALTLLTVAAFAQSPVGSWKGKIKMDASTMPKAQNAQQQEAMNKAMAQLSSMTLMLTMKGDKTYTVSVPGMMGQPAHKSEGKWSQKGNQITMTTVKNDGKPATANKTQTMTIDAGGKKMTMKVPNGPGNVQIIFSK